MMLLTSLRFPLRALKAINLSFIRVTGLLLLICFMSACFAPSFLWVGIAEDQTGPLSEISRELDQGRRLTQLMYAQETKSKSLLRFKNIDTLNSPEKTANAFRSLVDQHHVQMLLGVPSSDCAQVARHVASFRQIPFICNAYDSSLIHNTQDLLVFRQNPSQLGSLTALYFFYVLKKNRLAVLFDEAMFSSAQSSEGYLREGRLIGASMLEEAFSSFDRPADWQVSWSKLKSASPDLVLLAADPSHYKDLLIIARRVLQIPAIYVLHHLPLSEDLESDPELFENVYFMLPFYEKKDKFVLSSFYKQYHDRFNLKPGYFSAQGHDEVVFLHELIQDGKKQSLSERFSKLHGFVFDKEKYLTGFRGFAKDGFSMHDIDVLKMNQGNLEYLGEFWMEILSKGSN
jgi:ABC-type branched-subunit amino acid transport system substrate-binding protein